MSEKRIRKEVRRIWQSPMNPKVWLVLLECGHEVWVSRSKRPTMKTHPCEHCQKAASTTP